MKDDCYHGKVIHYDEGEIIFEAQFKDEVGKGRKLFRRLKEGYRTSNLDYEKIVYEGEFKRDSICG